MFLLCGACDSGPDSTVLQLVFRAPSGCPVTGTLSQLSLEARGNFPTSGSLIAPFGRPLGPETVDRFPVDTLRLVASGAGPSYLGEGSVSLRETSSGSQLELVLAPLEAPCPLLDDVEFRTLPFDMATLAHGGEVLLAGGLPEGAEGSRRLLRLTPGLTLSEVLTPLSVARIGGTATVVGDRTVIAGGAIFDDERALDTFVVLDSQTGSVRLGDRGLCPAEATGCEGRRRDHGAVALGDGRVLLFGGVRRGGGAILEDEILNTAVLIDPLDGSVDVDIDLATGTGQEIRARRLPHLVTLDTGETFVVGGQGAGGGFTGTVYRFEPFEKRFTVMLLADGSPEPSDRLLPFEEGVPVGLPGGRLAYFTGSTEVPVLLFDPGLSRVRRIDVQLNLPDGDLTSPQAMALPDGTVFLVGESTRGLRSYRIDLGRATVQPLVSALDVPTRLLSYGDGALLEMTEVGSSYRRVMLRTPFDNPPATLLPTDVEWLSYDAEPGWTVTPQGASATRAGRIALAGLELETFRITLDIDSGTDVTIRQGRDTTVVSLRESSISVGLCETPWNGEPFELQRNEEELLIVTEEATGRCRVPGLLEAISVALELSPGATFRTLQLSRL